MGLGFRVDGLGVSARDFKVSSWLYVEESLGK